MAARIDGVRIAGLDFTVVVLMTEFDPLAVGEKKEVEVDVDVDFDANSVQTNSNASSFSVDLMTLR